MFSAREVLQHYNMTIETEMGGGELRLRCPFHSDEHPSFDINERDGVWICRSGCGGGNLIQFVMRMEQCSYEIAKEYIDNNFELYPDDEIGALLRYVETGEQQLMRVALGEVQNKDYRDGMVRNVINILGTVPNNSLVLEWYKILIYVSAEDYKNDFYMDIFKLLTNDMKGL